MISKLLLLAIFTTANLAASAQTRPSASPTPPRPEDDVVKITTSLIQVDVTITDGKGRIISDIKPDEVEIYENGKKQKVTNFSYVANVRERTEQPRQSQDLPTAPSAPLQPDQVRRAVALVVDDLNLSFESVYYVRRSLKKFVDEQMQAGDLVAIIRTGAGVGALQQFTSDKQMLYAAIEKVRWNPSGTGDVGAFARMEALADQGQQRDLSGEPQAGDRTEEGRMREFSDFHTNYFVTGTLGAVNYVVRGMAELPGRKSIMLFSDGFALQNTDASGMVGTSRIMSVLRALIDQANRSSVVIYTLDPRGLQVLGLTAADNTVGRTVEQIQEELAGRSERLKDTQDGLVYLAKETGGFAMINQNDLTGGIRKVLDDQSYYLVAYEPDDETFDPTKRKFNKLDIKVLRKDARVRYRSGFFGVTDSQAAGSANRKGDIMYALTSPFATNEIAVRLNALFGVQPNRTTYIRSLLHVSAKDISFEDGPDGGKTAKFDVVAIAFGDNGVPIDSLAKNYTLNLNQERYKEFEKHGFVYDLTIPIKKPGGYQLRIALKDSKSSKIGSVNQYVEVPDLKKKRIILSSVALENISYEAWEKRQAAGPNAPFDGESNPLISTALRQFGRGSVMNFGLAVYNSRPDAKLVSQVRLYHDEKEIYSGPVKPLEPGTKGASANFVSSMSLATKMNLGEYILRIDITDTNMKGNNRTATQFIQFEIVE